MADSGRTPIGIWSEMAPPLQWSHQGVSRVIGFLIEGAAASKAYTFHLPAFPGIADEMRADFLTLDAVEGDDWVIHEWSLEDERDWLSTVDLGDVPLEVRRGAGLAHFANETVDVEGWVVSFPSFLGARWLEGSKATLFPDAIPFDFPLGWPGEVHWGLNGAWPRWADRVHQVLAASDAVITFSEHVAQRHVTALFDVPRDKVHVVPLAPPDLKGLLPFLTDRHGTEATRAAAADILRRHAASVGLDYLRDFPFEQVAFAASASQDRPTKNLGHTAEVVRRMVAERRDSFKFLLTAKLHAMADWTRLPQVVHHDQFARDIVLLPDLPREVHAALFHLATVTVHSSFYEGIVGALPFFESVSVGTPCIVARGPHVEELLEQEPSLADYIYDPYDHGALIALIDRVRSDRDAVLEKQLAIYDRLARRNWAVVAQGYAEAALAGRVGDGHHGRVVVAEPVAGGAGGLQPGIDDMLVEGVRRFRGARQTREAERAMAAGDEIGTLLAVERGLTFDPENGRLLHLLTQVSLKADDFIRAEKAARTASLLHPDEAQPLNLLAEVLEAAGRRREAIDLLLEGEERGVLDGQTYSLLGNFHLRDGRFAAADAAFLRGTQVDPERPDLLECLEQARRSLNR